MHAPPCEVDAARPASECTRSRETGSTGHKLSTQREGIVSFCQKDLTIQLAPLCTGTPWLGKVFPLSLCASGPCSELRRHAQTGVFGTPTPRCFEHHNPRVRNTLFDTPQYHKIPLFSNVLCSSGGVRKTPADVFGTPPKTSFVTPSQAGSV